MAKGKPTHCGRYDTVDGFDVIRLSTRPLGNKVPVLVNRVLSASHGHYVRARLKPVS